MKKYQKRVGLVYSVWYGMMVCVLYVVWCMVMVSWCSFAPKFSISSTLPNGVCTAVSNVNVSLPALRVIP